MLRSCDTDHVGIMWEHSIHVNKYCIILPHKKCLNYCFKLVDDFVPLPGHNTRHTLLNVVRSKGPGRVRDSVLIDNLETREETGQVRS